MSWLQLSPFDMTLIEHEDSVIHTGESQSSEIPVIAHFITHRNPGPFTTRRSYDSDDNQHLSFIPGARFHGGSHPHLVNEFF